MRYMYIKKISCIVRSEQVEFIVAE